MPEPTATPAPTPVPGGISHLQPDGTTFPPVTPDPPPPPGYVDPLLAVGAELLLEEPEVTSGTD
jgi:hypothetical protein